MLLRLEFGVMMHSSNDLIAGELDLKGEEGVNYSSRARFTRAKLAPMCQLTPKSGSFDQDEPDVRRMSEGCVEEMTLSTTNLHPHERVEHTWSSIFQCD